MSRPQTNISDELSGVNLTDRLDPLAEQKPSTASMRKPSDSKDAANAGSALPENESSGDRLAAVMSRCAQGDEGAFVRIFDELGALVYGIVLKVVRDPSQSEEVAQEVFTEVWRQAPRYESSRGSVKGWVATIAHRRAVDRVRSEQSARNREDKDAVQRHVDLTGGVEDLVGDELERQRVRVALQALTDVQRKAVELAYYGGYTYREVAVMLGEPEGTIKTRIRDGLIRLRDEIGVSS